MKAQAFLEKIGELVKETYKVAHKKRAKLVEAGLKGANPESDLRIDFASLVVFGEAEDSTTAASNLAKYLLASENLHKKVLLLQIFGEIYGKKSKRKNSKENYRMYKAVAFRLAPLLESEFKKTSGQFEYYPVDLNNKDRSIEELLSDVMNKIRNSL